jgi:hypothetical protein
MLKNSKMLLIKIQNVIVLKYNVFGICWTCIRYMNNFVFTLRARGAQIIKITI